MASELIPASAEVLIIGGGALVGRALELLLRSADCRVRFMDEASLGNLGPGKSGLEEPGLEEPGLEEPELAEAGQLDGVRLLILAPGASAKCRKAVRALLDSRTVEAKLPVLELLTDGRVPESGEGRFFLHWPCRTEELRRYLKVALRDRFEESMDGRGPKTPQKGKEMDND